MISLKDYGAESFLKETSYIYINPKISVASFVFKVVSPCRKRMSSEDPCNFSNGDPLLKWLPKEVKYMVFNIQGLVSHHNYIYMVQSIRKKVALRLSPENIYFIHDTTCNVLQSKSSINLFIIINPKSEWQNY